MFFTILFFFFYFSSTLCIPIEEQLLEEIALVEESFFETEEVRDCFLAEQIQQSNIPLRITTPGNYCVVDNLTVNQIQNFGISIETSNVTLDLNGYNINGMNQGNTGIIIRTNQTTNQIINQNNNQLNVRSNITIKNGTIRNMTQNGIAVNAGSVNIRLVNVQTTNAGGIGFNIIGTNGCLIKSCLARFCQTGFAFSVCQQCSIKDSFGSNNRNNGFFLGNVINGNLVNTAAIGNGNNGFNTLNSTRIDFLSCQAHNNLTEGFLTTSNITSFIQCLANSNRTFGFDINGTQNSISECQAKSNGTGFRLTGINNCILDSLAKSNTNNGILLLAGSGQTQVRDNTATANGSGIVDNSTAATNRVYGNYANNNTTGTNFGGNITNFVTSPVPGDAINFTTNIEN